MRYLLLFVMATLTAVGQSTKPAPDPPLCLMKKGDYYVACPKPKKHKAPVKSGPSGTIDDTRNEGDGPHTMCTDGKVTKFGDDCNKPVDDGVAYWQAYSQTPAPIVPNGSGCTDLNNEECLKVITKAHPGFKQTPCANLAASDVQIQDSGKCYVPIKKLDFIYICSPCATSHLLQFENPVDDGVAAWQAPKPPVPEAIKEGTICDNLPETQKITCLMNLVAPEKAIVPRCDSVTTEHQYKCLHDAMVASPNTTEFPQCACLVDGPTAVPEATTVQNSPIDYGVTTPGAITIYTQDGYDCQITEKIVAFAPKDYPPNYEGDVLTKKVIAAISCTLKEPK